MREYEIVMMSARSCCSSFAEFSDHDHGIVYASLDGDLPFFLKKPQHMHNSAHDQHNGSHTGARASMVYIYIWMGVGPTYYRYTYTRPIKQIYNRLGLM
jgi:hypothetical protein